MRPHGGSSQPTDPEKVCQNVNTIIPHGDVMQCSVHKLIITEVVWRLVIQCVWARLSLFLRASEFYCLFATHLFPITRLDRSNKKQGKYYSLWAGLGCFSRNTHHFLPSSKHAVCILKKLNKAPAETILIILQCCKKCFLLSVQRSHNMFSPSA